MPHHEHGPHGVGLAYLILGQQCRIEPARAGDPRALHERFVSEARSHPVVVNLPDSAPMPPCALIEAVIERQRRHIEAEIGSPLDVGVTSENVGPAPGKSTLPVASSRRQLARTLAVPVVNWVWPIAQISVAGFSWGRRSPRDV